MKSYTVKIDSYGTKEWYLNNKLHCEHGPAIECGEGGSKFWYLDGKLHRTDGPAIEDYYGTKFWYLDGKLHREDGPAIEDSYGTKRWYLDDIEMTEAEFNKRTKPNCAGKLVEIDGVKYKLVRA
jgi:hypothetical protein